MEITPTTRVLSGEGDSFRAERRCFQLAHAADRRKPRTAILTDTLTLGSSDKAGFRITESSVSRLHARLEVDERGVLLTDLDSTNGTYVNGVQVLSAYLPEEAVLQLGDAVVRFQATTEYREMELFPRTSFGQLKGRSAVMRHLFAVLDKIAKTDMTVLITGESGTGKELVAEAIHDHSPRHQGPLVVVDCGSLPGSLVESELFGHEKGAFTGAVNMRRGAFELADGGTLFLDEIGELDLNLQPRLLRALESREVKRVGGASYAPVNVRVVAATNRDLERMVATGDFREDLYHRLAIAPVRVPPLRHRSEDIELLAQLFVDELKERLPSIEGFELSRSHLRSLQARQWPGNVRELRNFVERALVLSTTGDGIVVDDSQPGPATTAEVDADMPYAQAREAAIARFEEEYVKQALLKSEGNVAKAARNAQLDRAYMFRLIRKHKIRRER
jgi:transcriptional regulator with GAF, ATPase, and Fis domain